MQTASGQTIPGWNGLAGAGGGKAFCALGNEQLQWPRASMGVATAVEPQ